MILKATIPSDESMDELRERLKGYEVELETSGKKIKSLVGEKEDLCREIQDLENRLHIVREEYEKRRKKRMVSYNTNSYTVYY